MHGRPAESRTMPRTLLMADLMDRILLDHPIWNEIIAPNISELKRGERRPVKSNGHALASLALGAPTFLKKRPPIRVSFLIFIRKAAAATIASILPQPPYDRFFSPPAAFNNFFLPFPPLE